MTYLSKNCLGLSVNAIDILNSVLKHLLIALSLYYLISYLFIAVSRMAYPFELEWMEGESLDHVRRILKHQSLYVNPSIEFVPSLYTPLYFYVSALVSKATSSAGFLPLRLVSFFASLICFVTIFVFIRRETRSKSAAIIGAGLFSATFVMGGAWFDIARVDSLFLALLLVSIHCARFGTTLAGVILTSLLITLAFLTKQLALVIATGIAVHYFLKKGKWYFFYALSAGLMIIGGSLALDYFHKGWFSYYIFYVPTQHPILEHMYNQFWVKDLLQPLAIAVLFGSCFLIYRFFSSSRDGFFYLPISVSLVVTSLLGRIKLGGYSNVLLPAYSLLSILCALALHQIPKIGQERRGGLFIQLIMNILCIVQFFSLFYNPLHYIPGKRDLKAGKEIVEIIKSENKPVFIPYHGYLAVLADEKNLSYAHAMAMYDVMLAKDLTSIRLAEDLKQSIRNRKFGSIVLDGSDDLIYYIVKDIKNDYEKKSVIFKEDDVFWPVTGYKTRPFAIYTRKRT